MNRRNFIQSIAALCGIPFIGNATEKMSYDIQIATHGKHYPPLTAVAISGNDIISMVKVKGVAHGDSVYYNYSLTLADPIIIDAICFIDSFLYPCNSVDIIKKNSILISHNALMCTFSGQCMELSCVIEKGFLDTYFK